MKQPVTIQIIGPQGSGKTVLMRIIEKALLEAKVEVGVIINRANTTPAAYVLDAENPAGLHHVQSKVSVTVQELETRHSSSDDRMSNIR